MQQLSATRKTKANSTPPAAGAGVTTSECAREVLETIPSVMWFVRRNLRKRRAHGLSVPQFRTLLLAEKCDKLQLSGISNNLGVSMPTASRIVSGLVDKGFLDRSEAGEDRRRRPIRLTTVGQAALKNAWNGTHEAVTAALAGMSATESKQLAGAMRLLATKIAAATDH